MASSFADVIAIDAPARVARALVQDGEACYQNSTRDTATIAAAAITVLGATSDIISLASSRDAVVGFLRRLRAWGAAEERSELTLRLRTGAEVRLSTRGPESDTELLALADTIIDSLVNER